MKSDQDWHKPYLCGDINVLLIKGLMDKALDPEFDGKPCIYVHYIVNQEKYIAWLCFEDRISRDKYWDKDINNETMDAVLRCSILEE